MRQVIKFEVVVDSEYDLETDKSLPVKVTINDETTGLGIACDATPATASQRFAEYIQDLVERDQKWSKHADEDYRNSQAK